MPARFADAHTHLDQYHPSDLAGLLERATRAGVHLIVTTGTTIASSRRGVALAEAHASILAGVGLHPLALEGPIDEAQIAALRDLTRHWRVVCIGEIGLDFGPHAPDLERQETAFRRQVGLARELGLPIVVHSHVPDGQIELHDRTLSVLADEQVSQIGGIMHYFQADRAVASRCLDLGLALSFGKPLMRQPDLQRLAASLPLEAIVLETDAYPAYVDGTPTRSTEPQDIPLIAEALAEANALPVEAIGEATTANLRRILRLIRPSP